MPGMSTAMLSVFVRAQGIAQTNAQLAGVQANLNKTGASAGRAGALIKKGLMVGAAAIASLGVGLFKVGKQFDDAYDTIRVGTGATGKALEGLKGSFKNVVKGVPTDFKSASTAVADLNTRLGLTGKPLEERAKQFLELSRITKTDVSTNIRTVTRAFGDWDVKTKDQAGTLDKFFRAAQSSGATVDQLAQQVVQFGAPLRQVGFSLDEATALFAEFEKAGVNTQTMMPGLKFALKSFLKEGIDPKQGLKKTFEGIVKGTIDSTEAFKIFGGRATPDMIEAIKQGRFNLDSMTKTLVNGSDTIRKAGKDTMDFAEHWQMFKNNVLVALEPIAIRVFDGMGKLMVVLPPIAEKLVSAIRAILSPFTALGGAVAGSKAAMIALSPIAVLLAAHFARLAAVAAFSAVLRGLTTAFWLLNAAMRANPIMLVVTALSVLGAGLILAYQKSEKFRAVVEGVWSWLKGAFGWVITAAQDVAKWISKAWADVSGVTISVWKAISSVLKSVWSVILGTAKVIWEAIKVAIILATLPLRAAIYGFWLLLGNQIKSLWETLRNTAQTVWNAIKSAITTPINAAAGVLSGVWSAMRSSASTAWGAIRTAATSAWNAVRDAILTPVRAARDAIGGVIEGIANRAQAGWNTIIRGVTGFASSVKEKIVGAFEGAWSAVKGFINQIIGAINAIPGVPNIKKLAQGGTIGGAEQMLARGGVVNRPMAIVGEEAPRHPEFVIPTNPAYRSRALELFGSLGKQLGIEGFAKGGIIGKAVSAVGGVLGKGAKFFLGKLPGVGDLPDWLKGTGKHVLDSVGKWIKDKVGSLIKAAAKLAGIGGGSGPGTMSGTNAKAAKLAQMFNATITSGYRSPAQNAAANGAAGSSHMKGSPANPGAHDFVPASQALLAEALKMGAKWVDNHDFGSGLHSHVSWFKRGGVLGSYAQGTSFVPQTGPYLLHRGESVAPKGSGVTAREVVEALRGMDLYIGGEKINERIDVRLRANDRAAHAEFMAGVA